MSPVVMCVTEIIMYMESRHRLGELKLLGQLIPIEYMSPVVMCVIQINIYVESGQRLGELELLGQ